MVHDAWTLGPGVEGTSALRYFMTSFCIDMRQL